MQTRFLTMREPIRLPRSSSKSARMVGNIVHEMNKCYFVSVVCAIAVTNVSSVSKDVWHSNIDDRHSDASCPFWLRKDGATCLPRHISYADVNGSTSSEPGTYVTGSEVGGGGTPDAYYPPLGVMGPADRRPKGF